jgi:hypothetical protein
MFERGLPGYDDWLDNYGNPGIEDDVNHGEFGEGWWPLTEQIDVTQLTENPDSYRVQRVNGSDFIGLSFGPNSTDPDRIDERSLLLDGEYRDFGDDFIAFISILDEYHDQGGELGKTIRQRPFQDGDDAEH